MPSTMHHSSELQTLPCNKTGWWPALFLTFPLQLWWSFPYFTLPYSLLLGCSHTLPYVCLTLHYPILDCGHTLSLRQCGDCLICVFLILYLYNVVSVDCGPHFVFTPQILHVTWVSKSLLTLPLLDITFTQHYTTYPPYCYFRYIPNQAKA